MKSNKKVVFFYLAFILLIVAFASIYASSETPSELTYKEMRQYFVDEQVKSFTVSSAGTVTLKLKDGKTAQHNLLSLSIFYEDLGELIEDQHSRGILTDYNYEYPKPNPWWYSMLPYVIVLVLLIILWYVFISREAAGSKNQSGGGGLGGRMNSFSKARTKLGSDEKHRITFRDVAGCEEEKEELMEVVGFLKDPDKYTVLGAKIPKGVLLVGSPGTGKTYLAKAVAGEADVPFYSISGSDFVEMYVGVGASRVRDLFETAKKTAPCIIFIDEIDAVGRHRGAGLGGGHDEREQTLNQLLVEMDGFGVNDSVIIMAATNRPDILDPALLRPGRFDREVTINHPDIKGRVEILKIHSKNKPLEDSVDLETLARSTSGFTPADLANLLNEAALLAARKNKKLIGMTELEEANIKVLVGPQKKTMIIKEEERKATAYHEAGHALVGHMLPSLPPVHQVSIIPSGRALGYTLSIPEADKHSIYKNEMIDKIAELLGGRVAEQLVLDDFSSGASNDIQRATEISRSMVMKYGMSEKLGPIVFGTGHEEVFLGKEYSSAKNYSESTAALIDSEIHAFVDQGYSIAEALIKANLDKLHFIAEYLVKNEIMDKEQFALVFSDNPTFELLESVRDRKREISKQENEEARTQEEPTDEE